MSRYRTTTQRIFIAMLLGVAIGSMVQLLLGPTPAVDGHAAEPSAAFRFLVDGVFTVGGQLFISALKMLVVPLVFIGLVCGVGSLSEPSKLGRYGGKALGLYLLTTGLAVTLGLGFALLIEPGSGLALASDIQYEATPAPSLASVIIGLIPSNPVAALASANMLQIIVFAVIFGLAASLTGEAGRSVLQGFDKTNQIIMTIVGFVMKIAPFGVFCLMAKLAATLEISAFIGILKYFLLVFILLIVHAVVVYSSLLKLFTGLSPMPLISKLKDCALFAFSSASSAATLPVTLKTAVERLGVKRELASFTLPLGTTINMDGTAIMQGVATVFIAQVYMVDLTTSDLLMVILTATLASIGTAGVPGAGLIMLAMVLTQVNLPVEGIALIIGIDRLLDMTRTVVNVTGDCTVTCIVAHSEGELDHIQYGSREDDTQETTDQMNV